MDRLKNFKPSKEGFIIWALIFGMLLFLEMSLKIILFGINFDIALLKTAVNILAISFFILFLLEVMFKKARKTFLFILILLLAVWYLGHTVYYSLFGDFFNVMILTNFGQATSFAGEFFKAIGIKHALYILPLITVLVIMLKTDLLDNLKNRKISVKTFSILVLTVFTFTVSNGILVKSDFNQINGKYNFNKMLLSEKSVQENGLLYYTGKDVVENNSKNNIDLENEQKMKIQEYFDDVDAHQNNEMTGIFEDKNLILIMAESLDEIAIREDVMPNLYKMQNEGMNFTNFYSPLFLRSTSDTEFMSETSFFPDKSSGLTMEDYLENDFPNTFGNMFREKEYATNAYHNYEDKYYPRKDFYTKTLNYSKYYGAEELNIDGTTRWPSDIELMEKSLPTFINEDKFFTKMVTVSGHLAYNQSNEIVKKNFDVVKDIDEDEEIVNYFATHVEVDNAIGYLVDEVEAAGKLDDTIFMIYSDHRPYGMSIKKIDETSKLDRSNDVDMNKTPFIIFGNDVPNIEVDKVMATIDLMPTISNMFNLDMEYNFALGKDIFASDEHFIQFSNFSWKTNETAFYSSSKTIEFFYDNKLTITEKEKYKKEIEAILYERFLISHLTLRSNYFKVKRT